MNDHQTAGIDTIETDLDVESGGPHGDHPLEIAARSGFGPLSPAAMGVWHGGAEPCVTCGQLVRRGGEACGQCGQDLSPDMIQRMRAHAGPWYVLEHVRPFPGVSLDRIIRQVHRGLITETSIVRGPATDYQWRFAVETPGLCRLFRRCWHCYGEAKLAETICRSCGASLSFDKSVSGAEPGLSNRFTVTAHATGQRVAPTISGAAAVAGNTGQLAMLRAAAQSAERRYGSEASTDVMKLGGIRVAWLAAVIVIAVFGALVWITQMRTGDSVTSQPKASPSIGSVTPAESVRSTSSEMNP